MKTRTASFWRNLICLALGLITFGVFARVLTYQFLGYDDQQYVTENGRVQAGLTWQGLVWASQSFYASNWHPVTWLSHMLDCQLYGLRPAGHHLSNVLLHAANAVLLFLVLRRMTGALWRSAGVAALFAWHPLHVESVAWISERKDVLSAFFLLLTLWAYAAYARRFEDRGLREEASPNDEARNPKEIRMPKSEVPSAITWLSHPAARCYALALIFFALGLMSKAMLVTVPFVLLLLDYWPLQRIRLPALKAQPSVLLWLLSEKAPFLALSAVCSALTVAAQQQGYAVVSSGSLPVSQRVAHALVAYVHYAGAMFVPRHLAVHYPYPSREEVAAVIGAGIALALVSALVWRWVSRRPYLAVGWCWYLGTLVPVIGLVQVGDQAWADRYTYLPLVGLFVALVWAAGDLVERGAAPRSTGLPGRNPVIGEWVATAVAVAVGVGLLAGTWSQLQYWKNTRTLFARAAAVTQHNGRAVTMLGSLLAAEGKLEEAKALYVQALDWRPQDPEAHFHLGRALAQQGKLDEAITHYNQALWFRPLQEQTHIELGIVLARQSKHDEAAAHYRAALAINPRSASAENNLARVLHSQGRLDEAIEHYLAALRLDPALAEAQNNAGVLLVQQGRLAEGVARLREAVRLRPDDPEAQYNLALAFNQQEKWKEAAELFSRLAPHRPNDARLHYQFGLALAHLQRTREALSEYAQALLVQADFPEALDRLSWVLATDPHPELRNGAEAVRMAERAAELTGQKQAPVLMTLAAAYAEAGRFPDAIAVVQRARELAETGGENDLARKCQDLLRAFQAGKAWREP